MFVMPLPSHAEIGDRDGAAGRPRVARETMGRCRLVNMQHDSPRRQRHRSGWAGLTFQVMTLVGAVMLLLPSSVAWACQCRDVSSAIATWERGLSEPAVDPARIELAIDVDDLRRVMEGAVNGAMRSAGEAPSPTDDDQRRFSLSELADVHLAVASIELHPADAGVGVRLALRGELAPSSGALALLASLLIELDVSAVLAFEASDEGGTLSIAPGTLDIDRLDVRAGGAAALVLGQSGTAGDPHVARVTALLSELVPLALEGRGLIRVPSLSIHDDQLRLVASSVAATSSHLHLALDVLRRDEPLPAYEGAVPLSPPSGTWARVDAAGAHAMLDRITLPEQPHLFPTGRRRRSSTAIRVDRVALSDGVVEAELSLFVTRWPCAQIRIDSRVRPVVASGAAAASVEELTLVSSSRSRRRVSRRMPDADELSEQLTTMLAEAAADTTFTFRDGSTMVFPPRSATISDGVLTIGLDVELLAPQGDP